MRQGLQLVAGEEVMFFTRRLVIWLRWLMRPSRRRRRTAINERDLARKLEAARDSILAQSY